MMIYQMNESSIAASQVNYSERLFFLVVPKFCMFLTDIDIIYKNFTFW